MKQCLLCLNYTGPPDRPDCLENFSTTKNVAGFGPLEIVPISHILDGKKIWLISLYKGVTREFQAICTKGKKS